MDTPQQQADRLNDCTVNAELARQHIAAAETDYLESYWSTVQDVRELHQGRGERHLSEALRCLFVTIRDLQALRQAAAAPLDVDTTPAEVSERTTQKR